MDEGRVLDFGCDAHCFGEMEEQKRIYWLDHGYAKFGVFPRLREGSMMLIWGI